ncbi:hypothetical protein [Hydrocarboniclastica marina]|nr:hypothetical protein [Hydrocarboniclastica marina]
MHGSILDANRTPDQTNTQHCRGEPQAPGVIGRSSTAGEYRKQRKGIADD